MRRRSRFVCEGGHGGYEGNHLKVIMEIFRTLGSRSLSVTAMLNFRVKQIHLSTASERTTRLWYLMTMIAQDLLHCDYLLGVYPFMLGHQ